jgi:predicted esterase
MPLKFRDIKTIVIKQDTSQSYCIYLPVDYKNKKKWPVLFMFDSHGDGKFAIIHAKEAAERFGFILVGSNNSKNGVENIDHIVNVLFSDVFSHYSINEKLVYTAGFSGGGRVASNIAISSSKIRGVITCSAGLPQINLQSINKRFEIFAIAGKEDFNYNEVESLDDELNGTGWRYIITSFDSGHVWPPVKYFTDALLWFELNSMRDGLIPQDDKLLDETFDDITKDINQFLNNKQYAKADQECKKGISYLFGLHKVSSFEDEREKLKESDGFKQDVLNQIRIDDKEKELRNNYMDKFFSADSDWWTNEIKSINANISQNGDILSRQMYSRVKGFLGIVCYSYTSKAIAANNIELSKKCMTIYEKLEPKNPDLYFYKALLMDKANQPDKAVKLLKTAFDYGFTDKYKIRDMFSRNVQKSLLH